MEISESLSNSWLEIMGIDSSKFKIIMVEDTLPLLASGPTLFSYGNGESNFSEEIEKQKILRMAREECCTICGVHLDGNERNKKMRCTVCYFKKDDGE